MTPEQYQLEAQCVLEKQSREAIIAHLTDPSVQLECCNKKRNSWGVKTGNFYDLDNFYYRIAKQKKWYRVAKMKFSNGEEYPEISCYCDASPVDKMPGFIEWLDERKYYD